jgi:hypothetical protein
MDGCLLGLVSLALMMLTIKASVFRYKIETAVLILPVATMIAFAQLRASMPDAPAGFGKPSTIQFADDIFGADDNVLPSRYQIRSVNLSEAPQNREVLVDPV